MVEAARRQKSPNNAYAILPQYQDKARFTHFLEDFGQKRAFWGQIQRFFWEEVPYYMVFIAYYMDVNLQLCNYA